MSSLAEPGATTLYTNGRVLTLDTRTPRAEAVLVRGRRVAAYGAAADLERVAGPGALRVDLGGATLLPGLIDTHPHLLHFGAFAEPLVDLSDATSHDDIVARIAARARTIPHGEWLMTTPVGEPHYFIRRSYRDLAERCLPGRDVLDRATSEHPVFIQAWAPVIPNVCAFNSLALERLGISRETPDQVAHVWIEKDAHGEPTGILRGAVNNYYTNDPFMNALLQNVPLLQGDAVLPGTQRAMAAYNRLGVTTVYEGHAMGQAEIAAYRMLREQDALTVRVLTALEAESYGLPWTRPLSMAEFHEHLEAALAMEDVTDDLLRHRGVTLSRGGPCWPGFLRMWEAYRGPWGEPTSGVEFVEPEKEQVALDFCAERALRLNFIGAGYRDHDEFLERAEAVASRIPVADRGWILQHVFFLTERAARRYAALGLRGNDEHVVQLGKGGHVHRAHRRSRAAGSDSAPANARRRDDGRVRQRLGTEERLRAPPARAHASLLRQRAQQSRRRAAGHARASAGDVDARRGTGRSDGRGSARSHPVVTPTSSSSTATPSPARSTTCRQPACSARCSRARPCSMPASSRASGVRSADGRRACAVVLAVAMVVTPRVTLACQPVRDAGAPTTPVVLMPGLGTHRHAIATTNPEAQRFFDQGLALVFAFNHDEAIRAFERAADLDPHAIMPRWGIALALGPNINLDIDAERERAAHAALQKALVLAPHAAERERAYVEALAPRYSLDPRADLTKLASAYKDAMRKLSARYPDDLDAATLYAESLMNLRPWKLWGPDGEPAEGTREVLAVLESVLRRDPQHLGANHYYIHALEMSPHPERALESAKRLETLAPAAGHLVHMPSHVYMRIGDYLGAARSNEAADAADRAYIRARKPQGLYPLMYSIHNVHFLNAAEAMAGRAAAARKAAARVIADVKPQVVADEYTRPLADFYAPTPYLTALRFQRWDDVLAAPRPDARLLVTTAFWHFARGVARAARSEVAAAQQERAGFATARNAVPPDALLNLNRAHDVLAVAAAVLDARIAGAGSDRAAAIAAWRTAVDRQDALSYDEPPAWYAPVRESLGAALFSDGQYADAEQIFRADLARNPRNGRSLFGLVKTLEARGETAAAATARSEFERAWKHADVTLRMEDL